jgi:spoIIIJ-associated protein
MEWVETTGRTVEDALEVALDELGVDEAEVEYEVIEEPRGGFFGRLGGSDARIRARVKPLSREKPGERQRRNRRGGNRSGGDAEPGAAASQSPVQGRGPGRARQAGSVPERQARPGSPDVAEAPEAAGAPRRRRRRRRGGARRVGGEARRAVDTAQETNEGTAVETTEPEVTIEEQADAAEAFTQSLVDAFDLGAQVQSIVVDDAILVDVTGDGLGLLVGPRGATLNAIEELVRTVVQRQTDGHGARINVDVAGYRIKRREALERFTRDIAERVLATGRPQALEPMSAADRKVVHDVAAEIDGVATESEGEEPRRRVVLVPAGSTPGAPS